ncbi:MAG: bifunctional indole-3-glycerol-phosphate synthase TrpC/phosphoribosylanthranilate isomerase TrpF [Gammaproteobacteria bacterium]|nr:MAG: bifunctional indole-3-glycerol-phosphate synthase TrpC/phosphoribosylanthranilate isomerase TrpF [Gammaproteobacteria bacterium]
MSILEEIVRHKQREIESMPEMPDVRPRTETRSLARRLTSQKPAFILECKSCSPSRGNLIDNYSPSRHASQLMPFADAISVLTDARFFGGSFDHIAEVRSVYDGPILAKDFFISRKQVALAARSGADAILLMLRILDDAKWQALHRYARQLGMETLTEADDDETLARAIKLGAPIIGLNNRNFNDLSVNSKKSLKYIDRIPADRVAVVESGIREVHDWRQYGRCQRRPDAFLIGTALATKRVSEAVRRVVFGEVKVCGINEPEVAHLVYAAGASWGGLIFTDSPRQITPEYATCLKEDVPELRWAGVFAHASIEQVAKVSQVVGLDAVQLHGETWTVDRIKQLRDWLPESTEVWRALQIDQDDVAMPDIAADRYLIEPIGEKLGGNGRSFDALPRLPTKSHHKWILAGGIGPDNVVTFREHFHGMLDANSKLEHAPGQKCPSKIRDFFDRLTRFPEE